MSAPVPMYTRVVQSVPSTPGRPVVMPGSGTYLPATTPMRVTSMSTGGQPMPRIVGSYVGGPASYKLPMSLDGSTRSLQPMGLAPERVRRPSVAVAGKTVQAAVRLMPAAAKVPVVPQVPQVPAKEVKEVKLEAAVKEEPVPEPKAAEVEVSNKELEIAVDNVKIEEQEKVLALPESKMDRAKKALKKLLFCK